MPPKTSARAQDEKPDLPAPKERPSASSTKMRRNASQTSNNQPREPPTSIPTSAPAPGLFEPTPPTIPWTSFERDALHAYRREYDLNSSTSFVSTFHQYILTDRAGIGLHSPTMVRKRKTRRQNKDNLALAVRKHFNGVGIQENDVIVDFICKVRHSKSVKLIGPSKNEPLFAD
ncbi:hypothetical protein ISF_05328 [Cordyceps fumosorosea ARSEF 2679]|uniref:Histone deacetylase complex subunit SAP30 Sin3 binding domain-containing protein n=1 Tax=Cordyceps fumosorosea (strain ARSEF 2679) TaxID=1081104 RepID=A0A167V7T5_CORFA|nr:hypothetical protein ISF_05328 [Cordyceps fumosorosea ARSEF 2679]OAA62319.1 hypothetical protein ISF_05328 [Cordyceps fumosorosea ARSEF 2679]